MAVENVHQIFFKNMQRSHSVERDHGDRFDAMVVDTSSEEGKRRAKEANEYWERNQNRRNER